MPTIFAICIWQPITRTVYASSLDPGPCKVRPWNLGFRSDFGFSGVAEPEDAQTLLECIVSLGQRP